MHNQSFSASCFTSTKLTNARLLKYHKTSISQPWRSIFQPFLYSGVLLEVAFNYRVALNFSTSWSEF